MLVGQSVCREEELCYDPRVKLASSFALSSAKERSAEV